MDLWQPIVHLGGMGAALVVLVVIVRVLLQSAERERQVYRQELRAERDACERRHGETLLELHQLATAVRDLAASVAAGSAAIQVRTRGPGAGLAALPGRSDA